MSRAALEAASALINANPDWFEGAERTAVERLNLKIDAGEMFGFDPRSVMLNSVQNHAAPSLGHMVCSVAASVVAAANEAEPVLLSRPAAPYAKSVTSLADRLLAEHAAAVPSPA
jgi:hypothetical protein